MRDTDFDRVYAEYFSKVYKFTLTLTHDANLAEEITQEAFFKALKNIDSFRGGCRIDTWLCQIAKNTFYSLVEKRHLEINAPPDVAISAEDIEQKFADRDTALAIHRILHRMREPYKEVFTLRTFGELSFAQIAALFDKTESWARVTYHRARLMIKEELE